MLFTTGLSVTAKETRTLRESGQRPERERGGSGDTHWHGHTLALRPTSTRLHGRARHQTASYAWRMGGPTSHLRRIELEAEVKPGYARSLAAEQRKKEKPRRTRRSHRPRTLFDGSWAARRGRLSSGTAQPSHLRREVSDAWESQAQMAYPHRYTYIIKQGQLQIGRARREARTGK